MRALNKLLALAAVLALGLASSLLPVGDHGPAPAALPSDLATSQAAPAATLRSRAAPPAPAEAGPETSAPSAEREAREAP